MEFVDIVFRFCRIAKVSTPRSTTWREGKRDVEFWRWTFQIKGARRNDEESPF